MAHANDPIPPDSVDALALASGLAGGFKVTAVHRSSGDELCSTLEQPSAVVGRSPQAGVRLDDPSVSMCHAYLQLIDGSPYCVDLGSRTGVAWDDGTHGRGWIHPGQTVRIGMYDIRIAETVGSTLGAAGELEGDDPDAATLEVYSPAGPGGAFTLTLPVTLVGRHPACDLRFLDEAVSYFQCAIVRTRAGVWCVDVLSRRGTIVNGRPVRIARIRDGHLIELGKISLLLRIGGGAAPPMNVFGPGGIRPVISPPADPVAAIIDPVRELMEQFQQCFVTMAQTFTTMHQEHTAMMCEQMRQIQELLRDSRRPEPAPPAAVPPTAPRLPKLSPPKIVPPDEARASVDAHAWFLERLTEKRSPTDPPKRG